MKVAERLDLISKIGRELQARYTFSEIDVYLKQFGITPPAEIAVNSKWVYVKDALGEAELENILDIARDLELENNPNQTRIMAPPKIWKDTKSLRLFISHLSTDKDKAIRLKEELTQFSISGFVAHEDIHPTLAWQDEIERGLFSMDAFLAVHTKDFSKSYWTQQEVGFALGRNTKIISLRMGEDPLGFISKHQALSRRNRNAAQLANEIVQLLKEDVRTKGKFSTNVIGSDDEIPF